LILVDTNIFLELLLGRKRVPECQRLLQALSRGEMEGWSPASPSTPSRRPWAGGGGGDALTTFLRNLERSVGLYVYDSDISDETAAGLLAEKIERGFDDSLQYYVARKLGAESVVSFDRHFDGLDVPRVEPASLLGRAR
jgi:predicted nucleic acid-binding protein